MPRALHDKLMKQGRAKGLIGDRLKAYVFGTLDKIMSKKMLKGKKK